MFISRSHNGIHILIILIRLYLQRKRAWVDEKIQMIFALFSRIILNSIYLFLFKNTIVSKSSFCFNFKNFLHTLELVRLLNFFEVGSKLIRFWPNINILSRNSDDSWNRKLTLRVFNILAPFDELSFIVFTKYKSLTHRQRNSIDELTFHHKKIQKKNIIGKT